MSCPRAISRYRAMPISYGIPCSVRACSVWPTMLISVFVGYRSHGVLGALLATAAMFLPPAIITTLICRHWALLRDRPWARATERALAPIGIGLMVAGVYTLARTGVHDWASGGIAAVAAGALYIRWLPPFVLVLGAGGVGWLAGL